MDTGDDATTEAELIVACETVAVAAELEIATHEFIVGMGKVVVSLHEFNAAAHALARSFEPVTALAEQIERETAEHIALWDDEMPF